MRVVYQGIDMMPIKTHEFTVEAVYDDSLTDYLFSRGTIVVEAIINANTVAFPTNGPFMNYTLRTGPAGGVTPAARGDRTVPGPIPVPVPGAGAVGGSVGLIGVSGVASSATVTPQAPVTRTLPTPPVTTHTAIRHLLETPRGQLFIYSGIGMAEAGVAAGTLDSPTTWGATVLAAAPINNTVFCDSKNGPTPHLFSVKESLGDTNLMVVVWGCEFYFNEALQNNVSPIGALLSNRFSQTHNVDEHGWTTVVTEGKSIFRTDVVYGAPGIGAAMPAPTTGLVSGTPVSPDAFRAALFMPIPQGFKRTIDFVRGMEDVTGVEYQYTDTQVPVNFVAGPFVNPALPGTGAANISVLHRQAIVTNNGDIAGSALNVFERVVGIAANRNIAKDKDGVDAKKGKKKKEGKFSLKHGADKD